MSPLEVGDDNVFNWDTWLQYMQQYFGSPDLKAVVFWPTNTERGRLYVHLLDKNGDPVAFVKVSVSSESENNARLRKEADTLREMQTRGLKSFRTPKVLTLGRIRDYSYLVLEPLSVLAKPIPRRLQAYPAEAAKEYAGPIRTVSLDMAPTLSWWEPYLNSLDDRSRAFHDELIKYIRCSDISVCRAHGDLSSHNVVRDETGLWIYDWEESVPDAPASTDIIGFVIALNQSAVRRNPVQWTKRLKRRYFERVDFRSRGEFMAALAFRHTIGIDDAALIMRNWGQA